MKKVSKGKKSSELADYVYIRLGVDVKERVKNIATVSGSNMTIWIRQLIMNEISKDKYSS
jgi:predicted DNA-binding protein